MVEALSAVVERFSTQPCARSTFGGDFGCLADETSWSRFWKFCFVVSLTFFGALVVISERDLGAVHLHGVVESGRDLW